MPELPDVENFKRYVDATALYHDIAETAVTAPEMLNNIDLRKLQQGLKGHHFEKTRRHGKLLFIELDDGHTLVLHFGMTGEIRYYKHEDATPRYTRLRLDFDNGYHLAYTSRRKLGEIALIEDVDRFIHDQQLGPDAAAIDFEDFKGQARDRRGTVKGWLMDQQALAGIGNVYSDEILFQAHLHPKTRVAELSDDGLQRLYDTMTQVLETTVAAHADPEQMPADFLLPHRDEGAACPRCNGRVARISVSGRSAYYCPRCQPPPR